MPLTGNVVRKIANRFSDKKKPTLVEKPRQFIGAVAGAGLDYASDYATTAAITGEAPPAPSKIPSASGIGDGFSKLGDSFELGYNLFADVVNEGVDFAEDVGNKIADFATEVGIVDGVKTGVNAVADGVKTGANVVADFGNELYKDPEKVGKDIVNFGNDLYDNREKIANDALEIGEKLGNNALEEGEKLGNYALDEGKKLGNDALNEGKKFGKDALKVGEGVVNDIGDALGLGPTPVVRIDGVNNMDDVYNLIDKGGLVGSNLLGGLDTAGAASKIFEEAANAKVAKAEQNDMDAKQAIDSNEDLDGDAAPKGLTAIGNEFKVGELYNAGDNVFKYDQSKEQKPPTNGFVDDGEKPTPEELDLKPVGEFIQSDELMQDIEAGTVKEFDSEDNKPPSSGAVDDGEGLKPNSLGLIAVSSYKFEKLSEDKLKEITGVAKNFFTTEGTTTEVDASDLINTAVGFLNTSSRDSSVSNTVESTKKDLDKAIKETEKTSLALNEAEAAVKQAKDDLDKPGSYLEQLQAEQVLEDAEKILKETTRANEAAIQAQKNATNDVKLAEIVNENIDSLTAVATNLTAAAAATTKETNELKTKTNELTTNLLSTNSNLTETIKDLETLKNTISELKAQFAATEAQAKIENKKSEPEYDAAADEAAADEVAAVKAEIEKAATKADIASKNADKALQNALKTSADESPIDLFSAGYSSIPTAKKNKTIAAVNNAIDKIAEAAEAQAYLENKKSEIEEKTAAVEVAATEWVPTDQEFKIYLETINDKNGPGKGDGTGTKLILQELPASERDKLSPEQIDKLINKEATLSYDSKTKTIIYVPA
jgi:hypothetical protein